MGLCWEEKFLHLCLFLYYGKSRELIGRVVEWSYLLSYFQAGQEPLS